MAQTIKFKKQLGTLILHYLKNKSRFILYASYAELNAYINEGSRNSLCNSN